MNIPRPFFWLAISLSVLTFTPAFAASPSGGTISMSSPTVTWQGFPGPAYQNEALMLSGNADLSCTDGTNCDVYTLTLAPGDYTGKRAHFNVSWTSPVDDYDVYVHARTISGTTVAQSTGSAPGTAEDNVWDIDGVVTQGVNDTYVIHVVYYTVGPLDAYNGKVTLEGIPVIVTRTPKFVWGTKTRLKFSKSRALYGTGMNSGSEPSARVDYQGNAYVGSIRGLLSGGDDFWRLDLNPGSPTFDPFLRGALWSIDADGNINNPSYKGQPDQTSPDPALFNAAGDGGGDMDIAVGFKPPMLNPNGPPAVATTSLVAADISAQRSLDRGDTFLKNPDANVTVPEDDRNWMEFYGGDSVYLAYRELEGLQSTSKFYINRSDDGGLTYGPAVLAALGGNTTGNIAVDQGDGTVYFVYQGPGAANNKVMVAVGHPTAPAVAPVLYHSVTAAVGTSSTIAALFPCVKVAKDGTVYVAYSDGGTGIFIAHSRDQGNTWSQPVLVSDPSQSTTSVLPWLAVGDRPGSVAVAWYGANAAQSEDGKGLNNDNANWSVYFAESFNATDVNPTVYEAVASDHVVHASNISLAGLGGAANRNLGDFFQLAIDPQGLAFIAFDDDSNDFSGNPYVLHQTSGFSLHTGQKIDLGTDKSASKTDASAPQVVDGKFDAQARTPEPVEVHEPSPVDVVSIRYGCQSTATSTLLNATMKLSGLSFVPPQGTWRIHFASNPTRPGVSDRGDQWFLEADTDAQGNRTFSYGTATRTSGGGITYTVLGNADVGRFDLSTSSITMGVDLAKLNANATRGAIKSGSTLVGLRGSARAVYQVVSIPTVGSVGAGVVDSTRGGTSYTVGNCSTTLP